MPKHNNAAPHTAPPTRHAAPTYEPIPITPHAGNLCASGVLCGQPFGIARAPEAPCCGVGKGCPLFVFQSTTRHVMPKNEQKRPIDKDRLRDYLNGRTGDYRAIFQRCGFHINGERGPQLSGVLGPKELGEGENGNFSVNLETGLYHDHGDGDGGHAFSAVQNVHNLDFNGALEWIVDELHIPRDAVTDGGTPKKRTTSNGAHTSAPARSETAHSETAPDDGAPPDEIRDTQLKPTTTAEEKAAMEEAGKRFRDWNRRLMDDDGAARATRQYLTEERQLHPDALRGAGIGLAHRDELPELWQTTKTGRKTFPLWITIPVPDRDPATGTPRGAVKQIKRFGFDPAKGEWERFSSGRKAAMLPTGGTSVLYDPSHPDGRDAPVLVCEGEIDALHAVCAGYNAVTGTGGAGTWKDTWSRYVARMPSATAHGAVLCFDGDDAGRTGAETVARSLHAEGIHVRVATMPDGADVNDVLRGDGGQDALNAIVDGATAYTPPPDPGTDGADVQGKLARAIRRLREHGADVADLLPGAIETPEDADHATSYKPFPVDTLPAPARDYVTACAAAIPCPPAMVAMPLLSVLSAAIGSRASLRLKATWTELPTLWTVTVAPSGTTKSPAFHQAVRPVYHREEEAREEHERLLAEWKQADDDERRPTRTRYRTGDPTPEAVVKILSENRSGVLLARDELAAWIGGFDRYAQGASDAQFWIETWQGRQASRDRAGDGNTTVTRPSVPVCGTIQPGTLKAKLTEIHFDSGFAARLILCNPPAMPKRWTEADASREVRGGYDALLSNLYATPDGTTVTLSPDAKRQWIDYHDGQSVDRIPHMPEGPARSVCSKGITHTARVALILHLCERRNPGDTEVSAATMKSAVRLGQWLTRETLRVYENLKLDEEALQPIQRFAHMLPEEFRTKEAKAVADEEGIPDRTMYDWLDKLQDAGNLEKVRRGLYRKR